MDHATATGDDPFNLSRFVLAQEKTYAQALSELNAGEKRSHWMWFIFPQIDGLGSSPTAKAFSIKGLPEALAYLNHPLLGQRLHECAAAATGVKDRSAVEILGSIDELKLRSSATLFASISTRSSVFHQLLTRFFEGQPDLRTLQILGLNPES